MSDKKKMPADGGGIAKGKPDGVSGSPDTGKVGGVHGRSSGGESAGGAYPNTHSGEGPTHSRFSGGQTEKAYYGGDNPNATTKPRNPPHEEDEQGERSEGSASPVRKAHSVLLGKRRIELIEDSGVAAAEATGKVGTDAAYEREQEGSGAG